MAQATAAQRRHTQVQAAEARARETHEAAVVRVQVGQAGDSEGAPDSGPAAARAQEEHAQETHQPPVKRRRVGRMILDSEDDEGGESQPEGDGEDDEGDEAEGEADDKGEEAADTDDEVPVSDADILPWLLTALRLVHDILRWIHACLLVLVY